MSGRVTMVRQAKEYLQQRRSMGFGLESQGYLLLRFAKYVDQTGHRGPLTTSELMSRKVTRWMPGDDLERGRLRRLRGGRPLAILTALFTVSILTPKAAAHVARLWVSASAITWTTSGSLFGLFPSDIATDSGFIKLRVFRYAQNLPHIF